MITIDMLFTHTRINVIIVDDNLTGSFTLLKENDKIELGAPKRIKRLDLRAL